MTMLPIATSTAAPAAAPGWFPDPWEMAPLRYWDGAQWTGHVHGTLEPDDCGAVVDGDRDLGQRIMESACPLALATL